MILAVFLCSAKLLTPAKADGLSSDRVGPGELLEQAADYIVQGQYAQASAIYNSILANDQVDMQDQVFARGGLIVVSVRRGEITAEAALELLLTNYGNEAAVSAAVYGIADALSETRPDKAITLYQQILDTWPNYDKALWGWGQVDVVRSHLLLKNEANAWAVYQEMLADFSEDEKLPGAVFEAAEAYLNDGSNPQKSIEIYQYALNRWPDYSLTDENRMILANGYLNLKPPKPQKALEQFQHVLAERPGTEAAMWSQVGVVKVNILLGNEIAAESAYQALLNQFGSNEDIPKAVCDVADYWRDIDATKSLELYENALSSWPDYVNPVTDDHIVHWENIAILRLQFGNDAGSRVAFEKIINNFSTFEESEVGVAISEVTRAYLNLGKAQKALELLQYAQEHLSGTEHEMWIKADIVKSHISLGDEANDQQLNELFTDFSEHPKLPEAIIVGVAGQYYKEAFRRENTGFTEQSKGFLQKFISLYEKSLEDLAGSELAHLEPQIRNSIAEGYRRLGQHQKAISYYNQVVTDWPGYEHAWHAQYQISKSYKRLADEGTISEPETNIQMRAAYEQLLTNFPNCPVTDTVQKWLVRHPAE
jgi:tetratricopeptide (TPR) repeat protein